MAFNAVPCLAFGVHKGWDTDSDAGAVAAGGNSTAFVANAGTGGWRRTQAGAYDASVFAGQNPVGSVYVTEQNGTQGAGYTPSFVMFNVVNVATISEQGLFLQPGVLESVTNWDGATAMVTSSMTYSNMTLD